MAQGPTRLRIAHCGVSKKIPSSQRHFSYVAAPVIEHFFTISFTYLTYLPCPVLWKWIKNPCEIHGGVADLPNLHLPQVSPKRSNLAASKKLENLAPCPTSSHRCIPITSRRTALQTRTLKMENYEKCWLHQCHCRIEKAMHPLECQSHRGNLLHCDKREEQVQSVLKLI